MNLFPEMRMPLGSIMSLPLWNLQRDLTRNYLCRHWNLIESITCSCSSSVVRKGSDFKALVFDFMSVWKKEKVQIMLVLWRIMQRFNIRTDTNHILTSCTRTKAQACDSCSSCLSCKSNNALHNSFQHQSPTIQDFTISSNKYDQAACFVQIDSPM